MFPPTKTREDEERNLPQSVVVVVFPSLPVIAKLLAGEIFSSSSISEVSIAPLSISLGIEAVSGRMPGERKIISARMSSKQVLPVIKRTPRFSNSRASSPSSSMSFLS